MHQSCEGTQKVVDAVRTEHRKAEIEQLKHDSAWQNALLDSD
jgi:hypothetical protein